MKQERFDGAPIPEQEYRADAGEADPRVAEALAGWRQDGDADQVVRALLGARLLVGLVAVLDSTEDGVEKDSHMAAAMLRRPDGNTALLAFTSVSAVSAWSTEARPLPVKAIDAARAAISDGAVALLVDGECALAGPALWALAQGREPIPPSEDPAVIDGVSGAVGQVFEPAGIPTDHVLVTTQDGALLVLIEPGAAVDQDAVRQLAAVLAEDLVLRSRLARGLQIGVRPPGR